MSKWHTDQWFVSPLNYEPEVTKDFAFAPEIKFHDVTLRDGEQQAGLTFRKEEKIKIAEGLAQAGIHRIEAGMPAVSPQDAAAIKEIVNMNLGPEIFAFARCMVSDVEKAADCGVKGIVVEIPSSDHLIKEAYKWPLEKAIESSIKATLKAKEYGLYTCFFPIDFSRANLSWVLDLIERVAAEGHMDALVMVDTFGGLSPHAIPYMIKSFQKRIKKPIELHFHDDVGLGTANTLIGLANGASVVHSTVSAIGERAGNTAYEDVAIALLTMYGIDTKLNYKMIYPLSKLVQEISGFTAQPNKGLIGDDIFNVESGIIASWFKNTKDTHPVEVFPIHWDLIGHKEAQVVIGKNSGIDSIWINLEKYGYDNVSTEQANAMLDEVKAKAYETKRLLTEAEFKKIVDNAIK
ncbi:MAG: pyruvate carboxyltransferase [Peptococcaceae bacterium]|jgi:isopropylmalate/homocitrate/citramalate synthase|nr:pyruvate carboxyltransferase [Peptococcaceae bacterium]